MINIKKYKNKHHYLPHLHPHLFLFLQKEATMSKKECLRVPTSTIREVARVLILRGSSYGAQNFTPKIIKCARQVRIIVGQC